MRNRMYYPFVIYHNMPARVRWNLAWRCVRILRNQERLDLHPKAASVSLAVILDFMDAERVYDGKPTLRQQLRVTTKA